MNEYSFLYNPSLLPVVVQNKLNDLADTLFKYDKAYHKKANKILNKTKKELIKLFKMKVRMHL